MANKIGVNFFNVASTIALLCSLCVVLLLPEVTFSIQEYDDFVYGISYYGTNKSGELSLYKIVLILGCIMVSLLSLKSKDHSQCANQKLSFFPCILLALNIGMLILANTISIKLVVFTLVYVGCWIMDAKCANRNLLAFLCCYYCATGFVTLTTILAQYSGNSTWLWNNISDIGLSIMAGGIYAVYCALVRKYGEKCSTRIIWGMQVFIPINLLMYLKNSYTFGEETIRLDYPLKYVVVIVAVVLGLMFTTCRHFILYRNKGIDIKVLISSSLVITVLVMNSYICPAQIVPSDMWHHGEQITEYQQVYGLGQELYEEFNPSSGNFAMVTGGVLEFLCDGVVSLYPAAYALVLMLFAIVCGALMCSFIRRDAVLILAAISGLIVYNRGYMILPVLLTLAIPQLISNRSNWLKMWVITCMLAGVYYPVYGGALLLATMPFGLVQVVLFFRTGEFKEKVKRAGFWIGWIVTVLIVLAFSKLLINMALYTLNLMGQSVTADGLTLLGYTNPPAQFLPFLPAGIRYMVYLIARVLIPMIMVILPAGALIVLCIRRKTLEFAQEPIFLFLSASVILQVVGYTYTLTRADTGVLMSRTFTTVLPVAQYLFLGIFMYGQNVFTEKLRSRLLAIFAIVSSVGFVAIGQGMANFPNTDLGGQTGGLQPDTWKIKPSYVIDTNVYTKIEAETAESLPRMGEGFIKTSNWESIQQYWNYISEHNMQDASFVNLPRLSYFIMDVRAAYSDSTTIYRSQKAQNAVIEYFEKEFPIITTISSPVNYEIIKWMADNNYYLLANGWYIHATDVEKYNLTNDVVAKSTIYRSVGYGMVPNSFGRSMNSLESQFSSDIDISFEQIEVSAGLRADEKGKYFVDNVEDSFVYVNFEEPIDGKEYDYLYVKINTDLDMSKQYEGTLDDKIMTYFSKNSELERHSIKLWWKDLNSDYGDDRVINVTLGTGELLIPLGYNSSWRQCENNVGLKIALPNTIPTGTAIQIEEIRLLSRQ